MIFRRLVMLLDKPSESERMLERVEAEELRERLRAATHSLKQAARRASEPPLQERISEVG